MTDAVLSDLRKACDERARPAQDVDSIGGVPARYEASPASTEEASEVLRTAAHHDLRVVARGMGTKRDWGAPPESVDLILDTTLIDGVVEHAAGDLVVVVRAGTLLEDLQSTLAEAGQQLALDAPLPGATIGGTIALNTSGPRRLLYGTLRDLLIGVTFVRADGVVAKSGGKVVKNVAGYDFGKLLIGSYGTLGVVT
ncbi:MAG: glycolate oxidase binding subunit, partial [Nocardioidaceae bacterium]|nr:glycolate oxidase binding subunit [Nocardioidaceae bacterium]